MFCASVFGARPMLTKRQIADIQAKVISGEAGFPLAFQALGDPRRFQIFRMLMRYRDICVTDVAHILGVTVSAASQQLRVLERLGLVRKIRVGQMVCYEINTHNRIAERLVALFSAKGGFASGKKGRINNF